MNPPGQPGHRDSRAADAHPPLARGARGALLGGRWRLERLIASGGMGEVWAACHDRLGKPVAVKLVRVDTEGGRERLVREALAVASLRHPNVVEVYDLGETEDGAPFVVMELLDGVSLGDRIAEGPLPVKLAARIARDVAAGLAAAHARGIIHRDVKPDNVQLASAIDGSLRPCLIDFGIAADLRGEKPRLTSTGAIVGTPAYIAPEQLAGKADERTDLWGLGITLYEAIAGRSPFHHESMVVVMRRIMDEPPAFPRDAVGLDGGLWAILMRALRKEPADRFARAEDMRDALEAWLAAREAPRPTTPAQVMTTTLETPVAPPPPEVKPRYEPLLYVPERREEHAPLSLPRLGAPPDARADDDGEAPAVSLDALFLRNLGDA